MGSRSVVHPGDRGELPAGSVASHGMRALGNRSAIALVVAVLTSLLAGCAPVQHGPYPPGYTPDPNEYGQAPHGWARVAVSPLSARHGATATWVDRQFLVIGGTGEGHALRDGAAYDPNTDHWTPIAAAPVAIPTADYALFDSDLYVITSTSSDPRKRVFLRYDPEADAWTRLPAPPSRPGHLLAEPSSLIDVADATTGAGPADYSFTPGSTWKPTTLPADPIGPSHDRRLFWGDGDLILFAQPGPPSSRPSPVQTSAIYSSRGWSPPETLPTVGTDPVLVDDSTFVFPDRGQRLGADGKHHPSGVIGRAQTWTPLPATDLAPMTDAGITGTLLLGDTVLHDGLLLDLSTGTYRRPPTFIGAPRTDAAAAAGNSLFVWGGTGNHTRQDLSDGYLLYP